MDWPLVDSFTGTSRYQVVRRLGGGGMGVVYEVKDLERNGKHVALKILRDQDPQALSRLKREFRSLADVRHPNLVALYELVADGDTCFFTMEHIEGVDFHTWLRPQAHRLADTPTAGLDATAITPSAPRGPVEPERLKQAFSQLALGVHAIHAHGRLHRDLKPSNVLVDDTGRVVILDFGLVSEASGTTESVSESAGKSIVGTASYMAPEQGLTGPVTPASDWYAYGVMLFQALTGRLPFEGAAMQVILDKQRRPAPAPRELVAATPPELDELCVALLRREPSERPGAELLLAAFGAARPVARPPVKADTDFVGREKELQALRDALERSREGAPALVRVIGASGIGKSALVKRFVAEAEREGAVVLSGRCYERETVPYKALDAVIDALARHLVALPPDKADVLLPRDAHALARMFPVLQRVPAFRSAPARPIAEAQEQRRRANAALRELIQRMTDRHPVVLVVDDAQWGDTDSALVLEELVRPPDAPGLLLIISSRSEASPVAGLQLAPVDLRLAPLSREEMRELALEATHGDEARAAVAVEESAGNPFLLLQLAEHGASGGARLEDVVSTRLAALPVQARRLLDVVAVAGAPVPEKVALAVAKLDAGDLDAVHTLKVGHLVRGVGDATTLESWHDRIRETVTSLLEPARVQEIHAALADQLSTLPDVDVDTLAWHLSAAGKVEQATEAMLTAAKNAAAQLAFERAAVLFKRVLELLPRTDRRRRGLAVSCAHCLADAGRGPEAAHQYRSAVEEAGELAIGEGEALDLQRRAAEQLLRSGRVDEGLDAIGQVLEKVGMALPKTPAGAVFSYVMRRTQARLRGLEFKARRSEEIPELTLRKIDICWSLSMGLSMVDVVRGQAFNARHLLLALSAGEPTRVARALAVEGGYLATAGIKVERRVNGLLDRARRMADEIGDPWLHGLVAICGGLARFMVGQWREARALSSQAEQRYADMGSAVIWEAATARLTLVWNHFFLGEVAELSRRVPVLLREAKVRGDLYAATSLQAGLANVMHLVHGDSKQARAVVREAMGFWSSRSFQFQHYWALLSETFIDLYDGTPEDAWRRLEDSWPQLVGSRLLMVQNVRIEALALKGRVAVATGRRAATQDVIERLEAERVGWARAFAASLRSQLPGAQAQQQRDAVSKLEGADLALFAKVARSRHAQTDPSLRAEGEEALAWMRTQGIVDPDRFANTLIPVWGCDPSTGSRRAG